MKIEISLFDAQLNAFFTIVKSFSWANAYAEKCNPQLNAFFTTWPWSGSGNFAKHQESGMVAWFNALYMMAATGLMDLTVLLSHTKTGSWFTRSLFFSYQRAWKAQLLAVLPSKSDAKTTQGQSSSSNDWSNTRSVACVRKAWLLRLWSSRRRGWRNNRSSVGHCETVILITSNLSCVTRDRSLRDGVSILVTISLVVEL